MAYKVNENQLPEDYFPLRLVGPDLKKSEMIGQIVQLSVDVEAIPVGEATATEPAATEPAATGPATVTEADATLTISGAVNQTVFLNEAALRALEVVKINATNSKGVTKEYEGVRLSTLLALAGVKDSATTIRFTASDGYSVDVPVADLKACTDCLLAFTSTADSFTLVMPGMDGGFWVKDLNKITVR